MPTEEKASELRPVGVLSASTDLGLSQLRVLLLQQFGFDATYSESKQHAVEWIEKLGFDVLVFGSTLARDTCWELAGVFRTRNSSGKIIEILPTPWAAPKNQPDATVLSSNEADKMPATTRSLLV